MQTLFFDTETTGLPNWSIPSEDPCQPHIVQLAALLVDDESMEVIDSMDLIVKPDGWVIPDEVIAVHGITNEYAAEVGVPERDATQNLLDLWERSALVVGHNVSFDKRIMRIAIKRYFDDELAERFKEFPHACTGLLAKPIMCMPPKGRYGWKMPKLTEAYSHFAGRELEGAHSAAADARACMEVFYSIQARTIKECEASA